jgi:hypothetical protein
MHKLAVRRTEHLGLVAVHQSLGDVLASAYMQGVNDTLDAIDSKEGNPK